MSDVTPEPGQPADLPTGETPYSPKSGTETSDETQVVSGDQVEGLMGVLPDDDAERLELYQQTEAGKAWVEGEGDRNTAAEEQAKAAQEEADAANEEARARRDAVLKAREEAEAQAEKDASNQENNPSS